MTVEARGGTVGCWAPQLQLYLGADGRVGPCCRSTRSYGNIRSRRLGELWADAWRAELAHGLASGSWPTGCERCELEAALGDGGSPYAGSFDSWVERLGAPDGVWPARMEFNLSNRCNLACIQCDGDLSSTIRRVREKRPPMEPAYGEQFFADVGAFLPHLRHASFAGGEPFLAEENHRLWDMLAAVNPGLPISITTNATRWDERVEEVLDAFGVEPVVSVDGFSRETFEAIRVGADRDRVFANLERFVEYARDRGTVASINTCVMPQNLVELPDLVAHAESLGVFVNTLVVHGPVHASLPQLPRADLAGLTETFRHNAGSVQGGLVVNRDVLGRIEAQLDAWLGGVRAEPDAGGAETVWTINSPSILQFRRRGSGPRDTTPELADLEAWSGSPVHVVRVGPDERTHGWPPALVERLGLDRDELEGTPMSVLLDVVDRYEVLDEHDDGYLAEFSGPGLLGRVALVPVRDDDGWCDEVHALFAVVATSDERGQAESRRILQPLPDSRS